MPSLLKKIHNEIDLKVDNMYTKRKFNSDEDRLRFLFELYEKNKKDFKLT